MSCMILIWKSVDKVPVVTGLYVAEELEESELESTEISRGRCMINSMVVKLRKRKKSRRCVLKTVHWLTLLEIHFLG